MNNHKINLFLQKVKFVLNEYQIDSEYNFDFSDSSRAFAQSNDWTECLVEFSNYMQQILQNHLSNQHQFLTTPYVRNVDFQNGKSMRIAVFNQQSLDWYGSEHFLATCDFLVEEKLGLFEGCSRYLDLGGHQMIWAIYYAMTDEKSKVLSFEPSVLNVLIGTFNCLMNQVIDRVDIVPFAVSAERVNEKDNSKMLVDYMNIPLRSVYIGDYLGDDFDFIKTDIEGYEYELLGANCYIEALKKCKASHFELHLGHLMRRGITVIDCISILQHHKIHAKEFYSKQDMFEFLSDCNPDSYPAFIINNKEQ